MLRKMAPPPAMAPPPNLARKLSKSPSQRSQTPGALESDGPTLPPRRVDTGGSTEPGKGAGKPGRSLMDDADGDMEDLKEWQVLRPG